MKVFYIDLFSGAGGTTTGIHLAGINNLSVVACVNHDQQAIESHKANHPDCLHLVEDVRDWNVVVALKKLVKQLRKEHEGCMINIWASLECTNFSNAKGGLPREEDSRTLANALFMYIEELKPEYLFIENVREFMAWGPLDDKGKPVSRKKGIDYIKWINTVKAYGYNYDHTFLNSADFGAYTSRVRYFGQFAMKNLPMHWPEPTHSKKPVHNGLFADEKKWKPVKDVLDLNDEGQSIFTRKKPLVESTLKRIYAGLIKFVAGGEDAFTKVYNSGSDSQRVKSLRSPIGSLTTQNSHAIIKVAFLKKYFSGRPMGKVIPVTMPAGAIKTIDSHALVQTFLTSYYGNGMPHSTNEPCPTVTTKDRFNNVFIDQQYGNGSPASADKPASTLTAVPKLNIVQTKSHYILNPGWFGHSTSIEKPAPVIVARQDKAPLYLIESEYGMSGIIVFENDSETLIKIKEFMALYGIIDIKMRMLKVVELKRIQGFPEDYILKGTQTEQKKFIGNAVVPDVAKHIAAKNYQVLSNDKNLAI